MEQKRVIQEFGEYFLGTSYTLDLVARARKPTVWAFPGTYEVWSPGLSPEAVILTMPLGLSSLPLTRGEIGERVANPRSPSWASSDIRSKTRPL